MKTSGENPCDIFILFSPQFFRSQIYGCGTDPSDGCNGGKSANTHHQLQKTDTGSTDLA